MLYAAITAKIKGRAKKTGMAEGDRWFPINDARRYVVSIERNGATKSATKVIKRALISFVPERKIK